MFVHLLALLVLMVAPFSSAGSNGTQYTDDYDLNRFFNTKLCDLDSTASRIVSAGFTFVSQDTRVYDVLHQFHTDAPYITTHGLRFYDTDGNLVAYRYVDLDQFPGDMVMTTEETESYARADEHKADLVDVDPDDLMEAAESCLAAIATELGLHYICGFNSGKCKSCNKPWTGKTVNRKCGCLKDIVDKICPTYHV